MRFQVKLPAAANIRNAAAGVLASRLAERNSRKEMLAAALPAPLTCLVAPRSVSCLVQMSARSVPLCPGPFVLTSTQRTC